jgi:hypothetical protein
LHSSGRQTPLKTHAWFNTLTASCEKSYSALDLKITRGLKFGGTFLRESIHQGNTLLYIGSCRADITTITLSEVTPP